MISFNITVYGFVFIAICALLSAMVVGCRWYCKKDNDFYVSEPVEVAYCVTMSVLGVAIIVMLLIGTIGFDTVTYEATDYNLEAMVADLRSDGIEVIEKDHNGNYLRDRYIPFTGKTKYYWYHNETAEKYLINKGNE